MAKKKLLAKQPSEVRQCSNIKSRKHPDSRCTLSASEGDFCSRHTKNPIRFQEAFIHDSTNSVKKGKAVLILQRAWKLYRPLLRFNRQGPAVNCPNLAENNSDVYTLESTENIPMIYRWSYADSRKHIWIFDIRSLSMSHVEDEREGIINPYTRDKLSVQAENSFHQRCTFLRARKYCLVHSSDGELTPDQLWHQKILDVVLKYDMLGYHTCLSWFEDLSMSQLIIFYTELYSLWMIRLHLSANIKNQIIPGWNNPENLLFKIHTSDIINRKEKKWWQKILLELLDRFISSGQQKEQRILGALYGMTAFAIVSPHVRRHYSWLVDMGD